MNHAQIIQQIFQQYLGRAPSAAEMQGFTTALQNGVIDPTGLSLFIQGSSQAQMSQVQPGVQGFQNQLQQGNQNILNQGFDQAQQRFALQGRPGSSGLSSAFAQVSGNLAAQQSPMIANYYGQLYQNALNPNQFGGQYLGGQQNYQNQQFQASQNALDRQAQMDYYNMAMRQAKRNQFGAFGQAAGGLLGAGIGAAYGGPAGAQLGMGIGKTAGGAIGSGYSMWGG